jgi:polyisoprenoid-binding protein YceI
MVVGCLAVAALAACSKDKSEPTERVAPTPSAAASATSGQKKLATISGTATFLIDAPLEKIKGKSTQARGYLNVDPRDLKATRGQIEFDLEDLKTETFQDDAKNKAQTGHAKNWFEIGPDVDAKVREENRWARFTLKSIDPISATELAKAANGTPVPVRATGDLWLHGVTSAKTIAATATFDGPPDAPTSVHIVTTEPLTVSLKQHDIKPRDLTGRFLAGALEKIGQKIDDTVQISLDLTAQ